MFVMFAAVSVALSSPEARMVDAINKYRTDRGLPELVPDPFMMRLARDRVAVYNHRHPQYGWITEHARKLGYRGWITDNMAQGYETPEEAVGDSTTGWGTEGQKSVGHDMQMKGFMKLNGVWVDRKFTKVGVAQRGKTYIAVFGT